MVKRKYRHIAAACARGFGKSYCLAAIGVAGAGELLKLDASVPHKLVVIMAPTHSQVIDIYYPLLAYEFGLAGMALEHSRAMGYFRLPNNVEIRLVSFEAVERLRGIGITSLFRMKSPHTLKALGLRVHLRILSSHASSLVGQKSVPKNTVP
jgi:hypothetical protein